MNLLNILIITIGHSLFYEYKIKIGIWQLAIY